MKVFIKILFASIISASSCFNLLAQQEFSSDSIKVSEEIATGHVFVDGVYIEPPYIVRKEGWKVFINGILVFDYQKPRSPYNFTEKPKANFGELDKTSSLSEIFDIKDTAYNVPLATVISFYYLEKYEYSEACDSIVAFHKTIPNVQSFTKLVGAGDTFEMVSFNNESRVISLQPYGKKHNQDFGPNQNPEKEKEINRGVTLFFNDYCRDLSLGNLLIYYKSEGGHGGFQRVRIKSLKIKDFCNILISDENHKQKVDLMTDIVIDRAFAEKVVLTFLNKSILIKILEQTSTVLEKSGVNKGTTETNQDNSPNKAVLKAWCPNLNEPEFQYFLTDEIAHIRGEIEEQGYFFDANSIYVDPTYDDHDFGTCSYESLKKMASAGFMYIATHGFDGVESDSEGNVPPAGIIVLYSDTESALNDWTEGDPNILIYQLYSNMYGECWAAIATSTWAEEYLAPELYENNTISILSVCHSYTNGWVDVCSGGICFGYDDNTNYWFDVHFNNNALLQRMNGTCVSPITNEPIYREAHDAYNNMPFHYDDFKYSSNSDVRLCPAPESFSPTNMEYIRSDRNSGSITFDSWCAVDNYHRAEDALNFTCTEGIVITDVHWVLQGGNTDKSNKIEYNWEYNNTESGEITVNVNPEYIVAYGGGNQQLDFDGVAPNGEQGTYKFFIEPDFKCGIVVQPSTLIDLSELGEHLVSFEALCNDEVSHYQWFFEGGTPSTSSLANPIVAYNNEGVFDVTLTTTGPDNQSCFTAKANYISVYDASHSDNDFVSCDYSIIGDKQVQYYLYIDYVPEGAAYDITLYYGDGYNSNTYSVSQATTIGPIYRTFDDYGIYNSYLTISYEDETEILYLSSCGEVLVFDPNPCGNFIADFEFSPEDPQPNQTVTFEPIIGNCSGNCYWSWEFANQASAPLYDNITWCNQSNNWCNQGGVNQQINSFPEEGNYYVKLTAYETANGCPPTTIEKEVPVRIRQTCYDPINIYCSHYKPENPIDRVLIRKKDLEHSCAMELYWHHTINLFEECQPVTDPDHADMYLYKDNETIEDTYLSLIKHSPWSSQVPWLFPFDYCYFTAYTAVPSLPFGKYVFQVNVFPYPNNNANMSSAQIDVDIVDCDYTASYIVGAGQNEDKFSGAVNNPPYYSSGKFVLNSVVNELVNVNPTIFTACNGVILCDGFKTGASSFVATGDGFADCIQEPICWWGYNYAFPNFEGDTIQSNILSFDVSPNPFRNYLTVHFEASDNANIILSVFNSNGSFVNMLKKTEIPAGYSEFEFDLSCLPPATYMLKAIINDNEEKTLKITKQ